MSDTPNFAELVDGLNPESDPGDLDAEELFDAYRHAALLRGFSYAWQEATEVADDSSSGSSDTVRARVRRAWSTLRGEDPVTGSVDGYEEIVQKTIEVADAVDEHATELEEECVDRLEASEPTEASWGYQ